MFDEDDGGGHCDNVSLWCRQNRICSSEMLPLGACITAKGADRRFIVHLQTDAGNKCDYAFSVPAPWTFSAEGMLNRLWLATQFGRSAAMKCVRYVVGHVIGHVNAPY